MSIPELFIRRPVMTTLVMSGILIFGVISYRFLPVSDLPNVDYPTIQVSANLPGASPETMASSVATPLEKQFSTIAGIDSMTSVSALGLSQITIQFSLDIGIDEVEQALEQGNVNLPTGTLYGRHQAFTVQANGQLQKAEDYRPLIVAYRNGNPVRLEELGRVIDSVQNDKVASWYNNTRAIVLSIQKQPGVNTVETVDAIKKLLPQFPSNIPASVEVEI